jgi:predicted enzyme related to lactoylglutathione lyase
VNEDTYMRHPAITVAVALALALPVAGFSTEAAASSHAVVTIRTSSAPTTLPITSVPATRGAGTHGAYTPTGTILMIKLYVGNLGKGERFYGAVFGAKPALKVGDVPILTFPNGGPGLVLLKKGPHDHDKVGGFIIEVPSLNEAKTLAVAHGAKVEGHFAGTPSGKAATSIDLLDPWGNNVEILQLG